MRNLEVYSEDSFTFYKDSVKRKRNPKDDLFYKDRLALLESYVQTRYQLYDEKFSNDLLPEILEHDYSNEEENDLLSLYSFKAKMLGDLRIKLTTTKNNRISNDCQNCTIGEVSSFDHYLPKDLYPEFAIHPKNLVPSCSICNSYKGKKWQNAGRRMFVSPYLDIFPNKQFLFVEIKATKTEIEIDFLIDNRNNLSLDLFEIIESHYTKLYLCRRFAENCERVITEIKTEFIKYSKKLTISDIQETITECANEHRSFFGYNHYAYILQIALTNNDDFIYDYVGLPKVTY